MWMISEVESFQCVLACKWLMVNCKIRRSRIRGDVCSVFGIKPLPLKITLSYQMPRLCWLLRPPEPFQPERHEIERRQRGKHRRWGSLQVREHPHAEADPVHSRGNTRSEGFLTFLLIFHCVYIPHPPYPVPSITASVADIQSRPPFVTSHHARCD